MLMGDLLALWPSAGLTLFSRYAVGSRDKPGFLPQQTLRQVLQRHLLFEPEAVLETLGRAEADQASFRVPAPIFGQCLGQRGTLVDCRSADEFELFSLPGARHLDSDLATEIKCQPKLPLFLFDHFGPMAGAAAVHFAKLGCKSISVLQGGLEAWSHQVDSTVLLYGPQARLHLGGPGMLTADPRQARFPWMGEVVGEGNPEGLPFECVRIWTGPGYLAVLRDRQQGWLEVSAGVQKWLASGQANSRVWSPRPLPETGLAEILSRILREEIQPNLVSHKGKIELVELKDGVAHVRLGGGCQGCSSAAITVGQEVAAALMRAVPELVAVEDASDHLDPEARPHH